MNDNPFNITREEILELAANKLADRHEDNEELIGLAVKKINERIAERFATVLNAKIDNVLTEQIELLLSTQIAPVNIWGEATGAPTTIRDALHKRAVEFWDAKVDSEGKISSGYNAQPRHQHLFAKIVKDEFSAAVKQNIVNLVGAFKDAVSAHAAQITKEHIDSLIKVKSLGDR